MNREVNEANLLNLEIFPNNAVMKEGDFNVEITESSFFVPMDLFNYFCDNMFIKDVSDFIAHLTYRANTFSLKFKWHLTDVETAKIKLLKQLKEIG